LYPKQKTRQVRPLLTLT